MGQPRSSLIVTALFAALPLFAGSAVYQVVDTEAMPGQAGVAVPLAAAFPASAQGFSMALRHVCSGCTVTGLAVENTAAYGADFTSVLADAGAGTIVVGVLMDSDPPFDGRTLPASSEPEVVVNLLVDLAADTVKGEYDFSFVPQGLPSGEAWVFNSYAALSQSFPVEDLRGGTLTVGDKPQGGLPLFYRGDMNQDLMLDIGDPIFLLESLYQGGGWPRCFDACDSNDDGEVDLADAIYLLSYCFADGRRPPDPFREPGLDWTPDRFDCEDPAAGWMLDFWPE